MREYTKEEARMYLRLSGIKAPTTRQVAVFILFGRVSK